MGIAANESQKLINENTLIKTIQSKGYDAKPATETVGLKDFREV